MSNDTTPRSLQWMADAYAAAQERERINYMDVQRIANERGLDYNKFSAALRDYLKPREWKGLTDEQIDALAWFLVAEREYEAYTGQESLVVLGHLDFARAVEVLLKEKNQ